jgi:hypothetical protein
MFQKNKKVVSLEEYKQQRRTKLQKQWQKVISQTDKSTKDIKKKQRKKKLITAGVIIGVAGIVVLIASRKK